MLTWVGEHDEAISIHALQMPVRGLLRRHCLSTPPPTMTPRNDNFEVFQQSLLQFSCQDFEELLPGSPFYPRVMSALR